ncbi:hypothetical protein [Streptomyces sp. CA-111067]|uniref:hypothetical protein n=1 Tax=Streptomyces sp. CA-111067 TaxID=3240046 RepID=UPI003D996FA3
MRIARTWRRAAARTAVFVIAGALGAGVAPNAFAGGPPPASVFSVITNADGTVSVYLDHDVTPDWLKVTVRSSTAADAAVLYSTEDVSLSHPVPDLAEETTDAMVRLPAGTGYGYYPVDVDFQVSGGTVQHWTSGLDPLHQNMLDYRRHVAISDVSFDRASTDYDHPTAVLSGHADLVDPATGERGPLPSSIPLSANYEVSGPGSSESRSAALSTDAKGDFRGSLVPGGEVFLGTVYTPTTADTDVPANAPSIHIPDLPAVVTQYRVSAAPTPGVVHKGGTFTVHGSVQRLVGSTWEPFAGVPVYTASRGPNWSRGTADHLLASMPTNADGTFSYQITGNATTTLSTFLYPSAYLSTTSVESTIYVPTPGSITLPKFTIDQDATVKTTGRLNGNCAGQPLYLQYSADGRTGWRNIGESTAPAATNGYCSYYLFANGGWDGWYRVYHPETKEMLAVQTQTPRLRRTRTQMSLKVSTTRPAHGSKVTFSGVVIQLGSTGWVHENKAHVVLRHAYQSGNYSDWWPTVSGYTDAAGRFSFTLDVGKYGHAFWSAALEPDSTHYVSASPVIGVQAY